MRKIDLIDIELIKVSPRRPMEHTLSLLGKAEYQIRYFNRQGLYDAPLFEAWRDASRSWVVNGFRSPWREDMERDESIAADILAGKQAFQGCIETMAQVFTPYIGPVKVSLQHGRPVQSKVVLSESAETPLQGVPTAEAILRSVEAPAMSPEAISGVVAQTVQERHKPTPPQLSQQAFAELDAQRKRKVGRALYNRQVAPGRAEVERLIGEQTETKADNAKRLLNKWMQAAFIQKNAAGRYVLTDQGRAEVQSWIVEATP